MFSMENFSTFKNHFFTHQLERWSGFWQTESLEEPNEETSKTDFSFCYQMSKKTEEQQNSNPKNNFKRIKKFSLLTYQ